MSSNTNEVPEWPVINCRKDFEVDGRAFTDLEDGATAHGDTKDGEGCFEKATLQTYEGCWQLLDGIKPNDWKPSCYEDFMKRLPTTLAEIQKQVEISSLLEGQTAKCEMTRKDKDGRRYFDISFNFDELDYLIKKMNVKKYEYHTYRTAFFETFTSLLVGISLYDNVEEKFKVSNDETKVSFLIEFAATKCVMKTLANYTAYCFHQWKMDCEKEKAEAEKKKALAKMKANHENHLLKLKEEHKKDVEKKLSHFDEEMKQAMAEMQLAMQKLQQKIKDGKEKVRKECENAYKATVEGAVDEFKKQEQALSKNENGIVDELEEVVIDAQNANVDEDDEAKVNEDEENALSTVAKGPDNPPTLPVRNASSEEDDHASSEEDEEKFSGLEDVEERDDGTKTNPQPVDDDTPPPQPEPNSKIAAIKRRAAIEAQKEAEDALPQVGTKRAAAEALALQKREEIIAAEKAVKEREAQEEAAKAEKKATARKRKRVMNDSSGSPQKQQAAQGVRRSLRPNKGVPERAYVPVLNGKKNLEDGSRKGLGKQKRAKHLSPCQVNEVNSAQVVAEKKRKVVA